jgi:hypothetical protein
MNRLLCRFGIGIVGFVIGWVRNWVVSGDMGHSNNLVILVNYSTHLNILLGLVYRCMLLILYRDQIIYESYLLI